MPTVLRVAGYRFFFVSLDRSEPPHIHVKREKKVAKLWLDPVVLERAGGSAASRSTRFSNLLKSTGSISWRNGMSSLGVDIQEPRAQALSISDEALSVDLV